MFQASTISDFLTLTIFIFFKYTERQTPKIFAFHTFSKSGSLKHPHWLFRNESEKIICSSFIIYCAISEHCFHASFEEALRHERRNELNKERKKNMEKLCEDLVGGKKIIDWNGGARADKTRAIPSFVLRTKTARFDAPLFNATTLPYNRAHEIHTFWYMKTLIEQMHHTFWFLNKFNRNREVFKWNSGVFFDQMRF